MTDFQQNLRLTARVGYEPQFLWSYLKPKYWGVWLGIFFLLLLAFVPFRLRDKIAAKLGVWIGHKAKNNVNGLKLI
ncbi:lipid A biosynthesis (KDO)2-(lauroyl)-lipid IVA acyltransferase [Rodentibacter pneumotropicus]|uniref:Lipid A biosynthesis (KDO)2-(Lauroyl)-lipid IVA acyltransferase n=1 Tax=Rodentibacter pneumotropicus TaxID=758 RepID=A0A3S4XUU6_9PAST|nr:lipid A biosynthesis (KDO)2-(lauroyl)-lipid IVA acyltransferase [Rodentibacter pneumotropicus]